MGPLPRQFARGSTAVMAVGYVSTRAARQPTRACRPRFRCEMLPVSAVLDPEVILLTQRKQTL